MAASENKALVRRFYEEAWDQGKLDVIDELFAEDYVRHDLRSTQALPGPEGMKRVTADFRAAFPDLHFDVEIVIAEDEFVAARWTATGTHTGRWAEVEPTGRTARFSGVNIFRFEHGKVSELWNHRDDLGLMEQVGAQSTQVHAPKPDPPQTRQKRQPFRTGRRPLGSNR